jgi:SAM-dependent methyltransferase
MAEKFDIHQLYEAKSREDVRAAYNSWAADYDEQIVDGGWDGPRLVVAAAQEHLEKDAPILDAGAGSGLMGLALRSAGFSCIDALDPSPGMLDMARKKGIYRNHIEAFLGEPLDLANDSYQAVLASGVFTPGHAPPSAFDELIRLVRPGGIIAFTLRQDVAPEGFHDAMAAHEKAGRWTRLSQSEPWQSMARYEPEVFHEIWIWRVN